MKAKEIIPEVRRRPDIENIPYGFGSGAPVGGGIPTGRIEPTLGQIGSQAAQSAARIKSVSPNQPLPSPNVWRSGRDNTPMRAPGDKPQAIDNYIATSRADIAGRPKRMTYAELDKFLTPPPAPGEKYAWPGAIGAAAAIGTGLHYGSRTGGDKGDKPASGQSTPQPPARDPNMTQQMQDRLGIPLNSQGRTASGATPAQTPAATTTPPAARPAAATTARPAGPQQGVVGSELARLSGGEFASRADRLNQARVDAILGSGYKAGSAAANRALRDYYKANPPMSDAQRQELVQQIRNQSLERIRQQAADAKVTVRSAGSGKSTETLPENKNELTRLMKLSGQR